MACLSTAANSRLACITLYFSLVDEVGDDQGPDSEEIKLAIKKIDDVLGYLRNEIDQRGILDSVNIILVPDHGMEFFIALGPAFKRGLQVEAFENSPSYELCNSH
jgi:predicted AlkP superfamily pyrophosphatase or phosphodiesterase